MSLNADNNNSILVVGIGNPLRSDDGLGPYVAESIEGRAIKGVTVWVTQQLQVEDLERMMEYDRIILVDASIDGPPIDFHQVEKFTEHILSSSHHLSAEAFVNLAASLYNKDLRLHLCSIRGLNFEMGDKISTNALERAHEAIEFISRLIKV